MVLLAGTGGCHFQPEAVLGDARAPDAAVDGNDPLSDGWIMPPCESWVGLPPDHFDPCQIPPADSPLVLAPGNWHYDTDTAELRSPADISTSPVSADATQGDGSTHARVISLQSFTVEAGATLRVQGSLPLIIASWDTIAVDGVIDASSHHEFNVPTIGAGASGPQCLPAGTSTSNDHSGGGGGGGYGGPGNSGGNGGESGGGPAGPPLGSVPTIVAGGCDGGAGGSDTDAGAAGSGGGAIQLTALNAVSIAGVVHAGGAGAGGATGNAGGGGGGSGGYIGLAAPLVGLAPTAILAANGGGGGAGCDGPDPPGSRGQDAWADATPAMGAPAGSCTAGVRGGGGAALSMIATQGGDTVLSGGGGGGGVGFILVFAATFENDPPATISPAVGN
jgi:hypothetical protein